MLEELAVPEWRKRRALWAFYLIPVARMHFVETVEQILALPAGKTLKLTCDDWEGHSVTQTVECAGGVARLPPGTLLDGDWRRSRRIRVEVRVPIVEQPGMHTAVIECTRRNFVLRRLLHIQHETLVAASGTGSPPSLIWTIRAPSRMSVAAFMRAKVTFPQTKLA